MPAALKFSVTAKGVSTILTALAVAGITLVAATFAAIPTYSSNFKNVFAEQQRLDILKDFLEAEIGWKEALRTAQQSESELEFMLRSLPQFWEKVVRMDEFLKKATNVSSAVLKGDKSCQIFLNQPEAELVDYTRKNIKAAQLFLGALRSRIRTWGIEEPNKPAREIQIRAILYLSQISDSAIASVRVASEWQEKHPEGWLCSDGLRRLVHVKWGEGFSIDFVRHKESDLFYKRLTFGTGDPYPDNAVLNMTPVQYEAHYSAEHEEFERSLKSMKSDESKKVFAWAPALNLSIWFKYYALIVICGQILVLILMRRFSVELDSPGTIIELDDPGFPANIALPSSNLTAVDRIMAWILQSLPLLLLSSIVFQRLRLSQAILTGFPPEHLFYPGDHIRFALFRAYESVRPTFWIWIELVAALLLTARVVWNFNELLGKLRTHQH